MVDKRLVTSVILVVLTPFAARQCCGDQIAAEQRVRVVRVPQGGIVPDAEVDDQGIVHLVYFLDDDVYYVSSSDEGESFSKPIRVNNESGFAYGGAFRGPDLAVGKDNRLHVVWYNAAYQQKRPKNEWGVMYSRITMDGTGFEPAKNLNQIPSDNYSLAADMNGKVAVVWMAEGVFATVSHDDGDTFSAALDLQTDPCECCGSRAIFSGDGSLNVLYRDKADNERDTYLASLPNGSQKFTHSKVSQTIWHIDSCPMTGSFLSHTATGLVAGWETKGQIYFARVNHRGQTKSAGEIHVAEHGRYPVVLTASDGVTVAAWKNETTLEWRLFDAVDQPLWSLGATSGRTRDRPAGVVTKNGNFLLFP